MEALILVEREQPPIGVGGEQQATMGIARPAKRAGPVAFWKLDGGAANPAGSNVEAPQSRAIIQSEYPARPTARWPRPGASPTTEINPDSKSTVNK